MEIARVRFRGDTAAQAVRAVARAPCVVCLRMYIRHTHRLGPPPVYRTIVAEETAEVDGELSILALVLMSRRAAYPRALMVPYVKGERR